MSSDGSADHPKAYEFNVDVKSAYMAPIFLKVKSPMDVMKVLQAYAFKMKFGLIILSALGAVRNVVLPLNSMKYYDEGAYQIMSLSGRIVPCNGEFLGGLNLMMSNIHGAMVGGVVESLVADTTVEVTLCPFYHDPVSSRRFDMDPPRLYGNPFLPSPSKSCSSSEPSSSAEPGSSAEPSSSSEPSLSGESCSSYKPNP